MDYKKAWETLEKILEERYSELKDNYSNSREHSDLYTLEAKRSRLHELDLTLITMGALKTENQ